MAPKKRPAIERFHGLTERLENGCLVWTGYVQSNGYAKHWTDGKRVFAHRWSYEYHVGPIPDGLHIDHLCRNRKCVEPGHLEAVTQAVNNERSGWRSYRLAQQAAITHCPQGHEYTPENCRTTVRDGSTSRSCKTCSRDRDRARAIRAKEKRENKNSWTSQAR